MKDTKILFVDDDRDLVDLLRYAFQRDGYTVYCAYDGINALKLADLEQPDIVVLDLNLPRLGGMEVLRELRKASDTPVIVLSAIGDEDHLVNGLNLGAMDYVVKPFRPRELRARVEAQLRRAQIRGQMPAMPNEPLRCGDIVLDPQRREVMQAGRPVHLTQHEFALLHYLMLNRGIVVPVSDIIANVWGYNTEGDENIVRIAVSRLRRKVEADPSHPSYLFNSPGAGYMLSDKP